MSEPSSNTSDILIVGAGVFGTSTAYWLSLIQPLSTKVTVLDRSPFPPHHAASTDINKIVRADYTSPFYMDLAFKAMEAWEKYPVCNNPEGKGFFHKSGWISLTNEGNDIADRIRKNFRDRGADVTSNVEINQDLRENWNSLLSETEFDDPKIVKAYWNPNAGWADASDAVENMMSEALRRGVKYETGDVESLLHSGQEVKGIRTKDGRVFEAKKVLLATGAWTSKLMSPLEDELGILEDDRVEKQAIAAGVCVVHYKLVEEEYERLKNMPVVIYGDRGEVLPPPAKTQLLKFTNATSFTNTITTPSGHRISIPPEQSQNKVPEPLKQETLEQIVKKAMRDFASRPTEYWRLCWDAITPSQDQLITQHPQIENLYFAVGGSFHSWKFLPIIGKYVANVLHGISNGEEMDRRWKWKSGNMEGRGAHEKVVPRRELRDLMN